MKFDRQTKKQTKKSKDDHEVDLSNQFRLNSDPIYYSIHCNEKKNRNGKHQWTIIAKVHHHYQPTIKATTTNQMEPTTSAKERKKCQGQTTTTTTSKT